MVSNNIEFIGLRNSVKLLFYAIIGTNIKRPHL